VTLQGAGEVTFSVRLGKVVWQNTDDGPLYHIVLVSEEGDNEERFGGLHLEAMFEPRLTRSIEITTRSERMLDALIDQLRVGGVLSADSIQVIRAAADADLSYEQWLNLGRTDDVKRFRL
jgi:hypothetical protein